MRILGFDLGDGESAVTLLDGDSTVEPRVLSIHGKSSVLSAVGMKDGRIVIGEDASVLAGAEHVKVRFKSRYLTDTGAAADVRLFAQGVMNELMREEPALMAEVSATVVGCPAGWGEGRREQYAMLLESAGFPNVQVVPEPRAAFLYARHARGLRIDPSLMSHSAMVVDIGSSTTDFAYIVDGHQQELSIFGDTNLGGGVLDELILRRSIALSPDRAAIEKVMEESPAWKSYCELEARRLKEKYFLSEEKWQDQPLTSHLVICYDQTLMLDLMLDGAAIEEMIHTPTDLLGGRSFVGCLNDALAASRGVSKSCPPEVLILTGGASRMAFFQKACKDAFADALPVLCPEPECSIARGLAYAGRVDEMLRIFRKEIASIARGERLSAMVMESIHELYTPLASALFESVRECAIKSVRLWRRGGTDTIENMETRMEAEIQKAFSGEETARRIESELARWTDTLMRRMEGELTSLCMRCGVPPEKMAFGRAQVESGLGGVKLSMLDAMGMDVVSGLLGVVLAVVGASLCGGGGIALVGSGPVGMIAGACAGMLLALLGKDSMEKAVRKMYIPVLLRQLVTDQSILSGVNRQRSEIERTIISALADPRNGFSARLTASLARSLGTQLESMARGAEMSICA